MIMELHEVKEIIDCLKGERTKFYYFRDRYALMLLKDYINEKVGDQAISIGELKRSPYANLLNKIPVKKALAEAGNGAISINDLEIWEENPLAFVVTLGQWGSGKKERNWEQMSRSGYQLVLQLNMANDHTQQLQRLIKPDEDDMHAFNYSGHPTLDEGNRNTLAWVRLDLDFETNEVLIEEIQCDWIRSVQRAIKYRRTWYGDYTVEDLAKYAKVIEPYAKVWQEATLAAAIDFIRHELGISQIYYHSFENGARLKNIKYSKPPRSLYTQLPKQFGFKKSWYAPEFLMRQKKIKKFQNRVEEPCWFTLPTAA